jgi:DNA repair exonuclease SbcCD ATPase subunit
VKIQSLSVEHFRCVRQAKVEFGPGLNVLHGPNDLGKSSLAHAIRAALLLPDSSSEHRQFVNWQGSGEPYIELTFETEAQRVWRVRKKFGPGGSSFLDFSRDGIDFTNEHHGRQVDGRLREILQWGVAAPGKGAPRGMPDSFLVNVLFAEQDRVEAIFEYALGKDGDDTGKKRLSEVLQAMAEDPVFRYVLDRAQERVDEAYRKDGAKRGGKNSPWEIYKEAIKRATAKYQSAQDELKTTEAIEAQMGELRERRLGIQEGLERARSKLQKVDQDAKTHELRQQIEARLNQCSARLKEITDALATVSEAEKRQHELAGRVAEMGKQEQKAGEAKREAEALVDEASEALARLRSEDRIRERQLKQAELEKRLAELRTDQERNAGALERINAIEAAWEKLESAEKQALALAASVEELGRRDEEAADGLRASEEQQRELRAIEQIFVLKEAAGNLEQAEKALAQVTSWRDEAARKRVEAEELRSKQPGFALPDIAQVEETRRLENERRIAAAKVDVGLALTLRPRRELRFTVQRDGEAVEEHAQQDADFETDARAQIRINIEGVAEISVSGGAGEAREELARLDRRWQTDAVPLLKAARAGNAEELARIVYQAEQGRREMLASLEAAAQNEKRIAEQPDWAAIVIERQARVADAEKQLGGADRSVLERSARKLGLTDTSAVRKSIEVLTGKHERLSASGNELATRLAVESGRLQDKRLTVDVARSDVARMEAETGAEWREKRDAIEAGQQAIARESAEIHSQIEALGLAEDRSTEAAQKALEERRKELEGAEDGHRIAIENLNQAREQRAAQEGALNTLRESAAKLDEKAARAAVVQAEEELRTHPESDPPFTQESLMAAQREVERIRGELADIDKQIDGQQGALRHVGGDVAKQRAEEATEQMEAAKRREREAELDFAAWAHLREALREAEQAESSHLGKLLAGPVASRFSALTGGRYGALALGPDLETQGIAVAGNDRDVDLLSVGTKGQLCTILRLTIAEQLNSAIVLDDQLTQSDRSRMDWLRDFLLKTAESIQVIVFTCRPEEYVSGRESGTAMRAIDLNGLVQRVAA